MTIQSNKHLGARLSRRAALFTAVLPLLCAGCSDAACFEWTENEGACPAKSEALDFFSDQSCNFSDIKTVDSEGEFDEGACCYSVTKWDDDEERIFICE